ncbi:MAG: DUF4857 domain-containing protein [Dysgonamonadaceae bacterium]|jgi:hypothetical protein|nr:DUF4857 domain-containing protein [Dysgonamonadaceae bacterium]
MIRFSKLFFCLTIVLILLWQLPWCYAFFAAKPSKIPFTLYSGISGDFISMGQVEGKGMQRRNQSGQVYTQEQTDSLLPFFYVRQLVSDERFPDTIMGVAVTPRKVQQTNFSFRVNASDINAAKVPLYPLMESLSGRVDLIMPEDVFRITANGIEFVRMKSNSVDEGKSRQFTDALIKKDFRFPARRLAGNPTARKDYDEGYLILDDEGKLFHLKQVKSRPYVRAIALPERLNINYLFITEFSDRKTLGFLTDTQNCFYVLNNKSYEVIKTGVASYNPETDGITIFGNLIDWTVCVRTDEAATYYALAANDYSLINSFSLKEEASTIRGLHFTSSDDKFVKPRF